MSQAIPTEYKHILLGDRDVPFIEGTSIKVVELYQFRKYLRHINIS